MSGDENDARDFRDTLRIHILDEGRFVRATFSGAQKGVDADSLPWVRLVIRPVMLKSGRHLQFSYFDARQDITKNYAGDAAVEHLDAALALPFKNFHVHTTDGEVQARFTKKGKALVSKLVSEKLSERKPHQRPENGGGGGDFAFGMPDILLDVVEGDASGGVDLSHDRRKHTLLSETMPETAAYLQAVGIMTGDGRVKADMRSKLRQINQFLALVDATGALEKFRGGSVRVVDAGCGNAYLTFALYHYLTHILGAETQLTGIDVRDDLMARHGKRATALGWDGMRFEPSAIIDYQPEVPPQIVVALHACDTATDEAIAQGIAWGSEVILCAPCCHHHLQAQLANQPTPTPFAPLMRHNIVFERFGDLLTDSFRALILRMMGYRTDVVQFVSSEHTPRDLMIRAVKTTTPGDAKFVAEYDALKSFWGVTPYLETLLGERISQS